MVNVRFDERNGKCTLVNARAVTDFARVGGKIMQMFESRYKCPLEISPRIDDRSNLGGRFSININVMFEMPTCTFSFYELLFCLKRFECEMVGCFHSQVYEILFPTKLTNTNIY